MRLQVARALQLRAVANEADTDEARRGKLAEAIRTLEAILTEKPRGTCTAEAGILLARLHAAAGNLDDARRALRYVSSYLSDLDKHELSAVEAQPFRAAAETLLRTLKPDLSRAQQAFESAEKLRRAGKFREASRAYADVIRQFSHTDFAPRSELHQGDCLSGAGRWPQAVQHWREFISFKPSGPWRGQAYLRLADRCLEQELDLVEFEKYVSMGANALAAGLKDRHSQPSWQTAAHAIRLREAIIDVAKGSPPGEALTRCLALAAPGRRERLGVAAAAARSGLDLLPPEMRKDDKGNTLVGGKVLLALSAGTVYYFAGELDRSDEFLRKVVHGHAGRATRAQVAYATFGVARCLEAVGKAAMATLAYESSLRSFPPGSWHDETLFRAAMLIGRAAQAQQAEGRMPDAKLAADALLYWQRLVREHPTSILRGPAAYHVGMLLADAGQWELACESLSRFAEDRPVHPRPRSALGA